MTLGYCENVYPPQNVQKERASSMFLGGFLMMADSLRGVVLSWEYQSVAGGSISGSRSQGGGHRSGAPTSEVKEGRWLISHFPDAGEIERFPPFHQSLDLVAELASRVSWVCYR